MYVHDIQYNKQSSLREDSGIATETKGNTTYKYTHTHTHPNRIQRTPLWLLIEGIEGFEGWLSALLTTPRTVRRARETPNPNGNT